MNYVDTGPFLALHLRNDQHHDAAIRLWPTLGHPVVTSNHVLDELATALARRAGYRFAADCVSDIYTTPTIEVVQSTREDEVEAVSWMRKYSDQSMSFTDCISFSIMRRRRVRAAFTFDRHFRQAGFRVIGVG